MSAFENGYCRCRRDTGDVNSVPRILSTADRSASKMMPETISTTHNPASMTDYLPRVVFLFLSTSAIVHLTLFHPRKLTFKRLRNVFNEDLPKPERGKAARAGVCPALTNP